MFSNGKVCNNREVKALWLLTILVKFSSHSGLDIFIQIVGVGAVLTVTLFVLSLNTD